MCLKWGGNYVFFLSYRPSSSIFSLFMRNINFRFY